MVWGGGEDVVAPARPHQGGEVGRGHQQPAPSQLASLTGYNKR